MLIVLVVLLAAICGVALHFVVPHRSTRGAAVSGFLAASLAAVIWTAFTWAGATRDNPLAWLVSIIVPAVLTWVALIVMTRVRRTHDDAERERLRIL